MEQEDLPQKGEKVNPICS